MLNEPAGHAAHWVCPKGKCEPGLQAIPQGKLYILIVIIFLFANTIEKGYRRSHRHTPGAIRIGFFIVHKVSSVRACALCIAGLIIILGALLSMQNRAKDEAQNA
jgi:hypothetical protein